MDFLSLAKKRYACRKYAPAKVEQEKLDIILEAGRVAPTGANRQPQRLIVVRSQEGMERLARCTRDFGAPCAVIVCADTGEAWTRKYDGKAIGDIDASIVTDHMMLAAASLGLDTLWICMFKPEAVREEFRLPEHVGCCTDQYFIILFSVFISQSVNQRCLASGTNDGYYFLMHNFIPIYYDARVKRSKST